MKFGQRDRRDFLILPFALFYFYTIFANVLGWPLASHQRLFASTNVSWLGALLCLLGLAIFYWSVLSLGASFRVGIDADEPAPLVTSGAFSFSRNPIYVAFLFVLAGELLIFSNWVCLIYVFAAAWLIHWQVSLEEDFLRRHCGAKYEAYCAKVRRYL